MDPAPLHMQRQDPWQPRQFRRLRKSREFTLPSIVEVTTQLIVGEMLDNMNTCLQWTQHRYTCSVRILGSLDSFDGFARVVNSRSQAWSRFVSNGPTGPLQHRPDIWAHPRAKGAQVR